LSIRRKNYCYDDTPDDRGRLSNKTYPDGKSLSFSWNSRGKLTQLTAMEGEQIQPFLSLMME
jgi:YD repeat-containing protein